MKNQEKHQEIFEKRLHLFGKHQEEINKTIVFFREGIKQKKQM